MHFAVSPADLSTWFGTCIGKSFDVVIAGKVFGGRYGESPQKLKSATLEGEALRFTFNTTEVMTVVEPRVVRFEAQGLTIEEAKEVEFGWYPYGKEEIPENRRIIRYQADGNNLVLAGATGTRMELRSQIQRPRFALQLVKCDA